MNQYRLCQNFIDYCLQDNDQKQDRTTIYYNLTSSAHLLNFRTKQNELR